MAWTVGGFEQGEIVRVKPYHPFRSYGWGVVTSWLGGLVVGVRFAEVTDKVPVNVNDLEAFAGTPPSSEQAVVPPFFRASFDEDGKEEA